MAVESTAESPIAPKPYSAANKSRIVAGNAPLQPKPNEHAVPSADMTSSTMRRPKRSDALPMVNEEKNPDRCSTIAIPRPTAPSANPSPRLTIKNAGAQAQTPNSSQE